MSLFLGSAIHGIGESIANARERAREAREYRRECMRREVRANQEIFNQAFEDGRYDQAERYLEEMLMTVRELNGKPRRKEDKPDVIIVTKEVSRPKSQYEIEKEKQDEIVTSELGRIDRRW